jgi:hypothetical protein
MPGDKSDHNILLEQYMLAACIEFHRDRQESIYSPLIFSLRSHFLLFAFCLLHPFRHTVSSRAVSCGPP